jgi:hypothetical protein
MPASGDAAKVIRTYSLDDGNRILCVVVRIVGPLSGRPVAR